jgi:hypothetical protein
MKITSDFVLNGEMDVKKGYIAVEAMSKLSVKTILDDVVRL